MLNENIKKIRKQNGLTQEAFKYGEKENICSVVVQYVLYL